MESGVSPLLRPYLSLLLFLPWDEEIDERYMDEMIQELNDTLVSPIEQLGNKSYIMEV